MRADWDVIVIGAGLAGLAAGATAIYFVGNPGKLTRAGRLPLLE